jgi:pyruvate dehydrogenase E2 component (dihydrolipoamide acetyltransferase)
VSTATVAVVAMPRLSDSMEEGKVIRWLKVDGDLVAPGDDLVEMETDKATISYQADTAGILRQLVAEGDSRRASGETETRRSPGGPPIVRDRGTTGSASGSPSPPSGRSSAIGTPRPTVAEEHRADLAALATSSGPRGRVVKRDVERALAAPASPSSPPAPETAEPVAETPTPPPADADVEPLTRAQLTGARRMVESHATVPDFSIEVEANVDALVALRAELKDGASDVVPSFDDFVVTACARALRRHPRVNAAYRDEHVDRYRRVNVGVAVAGDGALVVPVVPDADTKSMGAIAADTRRLAEAARAACSDHRVLNGADPAAFLADVRAGLEAPMRLLI